MALIKLFFENFKNVLFFVSNFPITTHLHNFQSPPSWPKLACADFIIYPAQQFEMPIFCRTPVFLFGTMQMIEDVKPINQVATWLLFCDSL